MLNLISRQLLFLLLYSLFVMITGIAFAQDLSLQNAVNKAIDHSPLIKSFDQQVASLLDKKHQTLAPSDPTISISYNDSASVGSIDSAASKSYQFAQPFAFPGKAFGNYKAASLQEKIVELQRGIVVLQVAADTKRAYYQLALARKNLTLHEKLRSYYEEILAIAKRRYESGNITQIDYLSAKTAIYTDMNDVRDLQSAEHSARIQLNIMLGNEPDQNVEVEGLTYNPKPAINNAAAEELMLNQSMEIKVAKAQLELGDANYKLAKMTMLPDFQVVAGANHYNFIAASPYSGVSNKTDTYNIGLQMTVPLWAPINQSKTISAAGHDKSAAQHNLHMIMNQSENALQNSIINVWDYAAKIVNYENNLIPLTEQAFKLALVNYSTGRVDFQALSIVAESWYNVQCDYNNAVADYLIAYSAYGQVIGEDL